MTHENVEDERSLGFSQFGEDLMILNAFGERAGFFVEVGANHPTILSQTYRLEKAGWSGIAIDPLPNFVDKWRQLRPRTEFFNCAVGSNQGPTKCYLVTPNGDNLLSFVTAEKPASMSYIEVDILSLNHILAQAGVNEIDYLSVDVEGHELDVLRGFDFRLRRPKIISIEDHRTSLRPHFFLKRNGYVLIDRIGVNNIYAGSEYVNAITWKRKASFFQSVVLFYAGLPMRTIRKWLK